MAREYPIEKTRDMDARVFSVGTTSLRALESYTPESREGQTDLELQTGRGWRHLFTDLCQ